MTKIDPIGLRLATIWLSAVGAIIAVCLALSVILDTTKRSTGVMFEADLQLLQAYVVAFLVIASIAIVVTRKFLSRQVVDRSVVKAQAWTLFISVVGGLFGIIGWNMGVKGYVTPSMIPTLSAVCLIQVILCVAMITVVLPNVQRHKALLMGVMFMVLLALPPAAMYLSSYSQTKDYEPYPEVTF